MGLLLSFFRLMKTRIALEKSISEIKSTIKTLDEAGEVGMNRAQRRIRRRSLEREKARLIRTEEKWSITDSAIKNVPDFIKYTYEEKVNDFKNSSTAIWRKDMRNLRKAESYIKKSRKIYKINEKDIAAASRARGINQGDKYSTKDSLFWELSENEKKALWIMYNSGVWNAYDEDMLREESPATLI